MLKTSLTAGLLACAMAAPAFAQTAPAAQPAPAATQTQNQPAQGQIQFIERIEANQFRGSDLMDRTVYNEQNENIGTIGDVIVDRQGQIQGVVIDVGGFLGLGASEVAVPFTALRFEPAGEANQMAGTNNAVTNRAATTTSATVPAETNNVTNNSARAPAANNAMGNSSATAPAANNNMAANNANQTAAQNNPTAPDADSDSTLTDRIVLATTRQDLEGAPKFDDAAAREDGESSAK